VRQINGLGLTLAGQLEERGDMAVVQLAGDLQGPVDEHPDALPQQLLGAHGRTELPGLLRRQADVVQSALDPYRRRVHVALVQLSVLHQREHNGSVIDTTSMSSNATGSSERRRASAIKAAR